MQSKLLLFFLGTILVFGLTNNLFGQSFPVQQVENEIGAPLPATYLAFIEGKTLPFTFDRGWEHWHFLDAEGIMAKTRAIRADSALSMPVILIAEFEGEYLCFRKIENEWSDQVWYLDAQKDLFFEAFSLKQWQKQKAIKAAIVKNTKTKKAKAKLRGVKDCPGCWYEIGLELMSFEDEENYNARLDEKATNFFKLAALAGHPEAADLLASKQRTKDPLEKDSVLFWYQRAIQSGSIKARYDLADFMLDELPEKGAEAIELLKTLLNNNYYRERSALKLGRLYMTGKGTDTDHERGIAYLNVASEEGYYIAKADLAFYYFKGVGVEKDLPKALRLLEKANQVHIDKWGFGNWDEEIEAIKDELAQTKTNK